jgi:hypothetical protein
MRGYSLIPDREAAENSEATKALKVATFLFLLQPKQWTERKADESIQFREEVAGRRFAAGKS